VQRTLQSRIILQEVVTFMAKPFVDHHHHPAFSTFEASSMLLGYFGRLLVHDALTASQQLQLRLTASW
jgi:hypothetical protein